MKKVRIKKRIVADLVSAISALLVEHNLRRPLRESTLSPTGDDSLTDDRFSYVLTQMLTGLAFRDPRSLFEVIFLWNSSFKERKYLQECQHCRKIDDIIMSLIEGSIGGVVEELHHDCEVRALPLLKKKKNGLVSVRKGRVRDLIALIELEMHGHLGDLVDNRLLRKVLPCDFAIPIDGKEVVRLLKKLLKCNRYEPTESEETYWVRRDNELSEHCLN